MTAAGPASFPVDLRLAGRPVLVVGGGEIAARKARGLLDAGALVTMVAPHFAAPSLALPGVERLCRRYRPGDLAGRWWVTTAVDDADVTAAVARDAEAAGIFCNAADRPEHCTATLPAVLRDGDLTVAVSTAGRSPAAASWVRDRIGRLLGPRPGRLVERAAAVRDRVRRSSTSEGLDWAALLDLLAIDDGPGAERAVDAFVAGATGGSTGTAGRGDGGAAVGHVRLVGAGPGDPDLLTLAAVRALEQADVVVHDALVGTGVLALVRPGVELIDVGKRAGRPFPQEEINSLLVRLGRDGRQVVRLKGGDPFVFGRGGEEALALAAAGVPCSVVPGVTSAIAAPALAGVPVTHRGVAPAVTVLTGHRTADAHPVDWAAAARLGGTLVVLMGVAERAEIAAALQLGGLPAGTPVAAVERGSHADQRVVRTTLGRLGATPVAAPATLVIGAVAAIDVGAVGLAGLPAPVTTATVGRP